MPISTRLHLGEDGTVTVMTGKVEMGQGARGQITQAAAEELGVPPERVAIIMGDTSLCPDDGGTWGSQTTPRTIPSVRWACAAAATILARYQREWGDESLGYADLAKDAAAVEKLRESVPEDAELKPVAEWTVLGQDFRKPGREAIVRGGHAYPSDVIRPGMLYGKILRPPAAGARLESIDLDAARAIDGVVVTRDGDFVGVAAPRTSTAKQAIAALAKTAKWSETAHPATDASLYDHLRETARGVPDRKPFSDGATLAATYDVPYAAHVPMEPRAAVAEFDEDGGLTVWVGNQNPFGVRGDLAREFDLPEDQVRVVVPDFGGGFGGKSSSEWSIEAAKLAKAAGKPVCARWTREEEFTWAYHRPGTTMDCLAKLDGNGDLQDWYFVNINAGGSGIRSPYKAAGRKVDEAVDADEPLRQGSYRALGSTANNFGRECFVDELAHHAKRGPLDWRLTHLEPQRLKDALQDAADRFGWAEISARSFREPGVGYGLACGDEKGSYVAACVEVKVDESTGNIVVRRVVQTYDCGAVMNPENCKLQVLGAILQGLGPAVTGERLKFANGRVTNAKLSEYAVPRFADVPPTIDIHLIDRPDLPSVGAGETPLIAVAPAIANAVFDATGKRLRSLPLTLDV